MPSGDQPLRAVESEVASQRQGLTSPLRATEPGGRRSGQGAAAVQTPMDEAWAVAFVISVVISILSAVYRSPSVLDPVGNHLKSSEWNPSNIIKAVVTACILVVPTTRAIWWLLLQAMVSCPAPMKEIINMAVFLASIAAYNANNGHGFVPSTNELSALCLALAVSLFLRRGDIRMEAAKFKAAALTIRSTPNILCWALCVMATRAAWLVVALRDTIGARAIVQHARGADGEADSAVSCYSIFLVIFWIWNAAWHFLVITNVVDATVSRSVSTCYSSPDNVEPMWASFGRVMNSSLGSLCKAAARDSTCALILPFWNFLPIICGGANCPMLCSRSTWSWVVLVALMFFVYQGKTLKGMSFFFCWSFFKVGRLISQSPASFTTARTIWAWAALAGLAVTIEVMLYAKYAVYRCFEKDPWKFEDDHRCPGFHGVYKEWRNL